MNKREALDELEWLADDGFDPIAVGITISRGEAWYAARSMIEAQRWVNFNKDHMIPGTEATFLKRGTA